MRSMGRVSYGYQTSLSHGYQSGSAVQRANFRAREGVVSALLKKRIASVCERGGMRERLLGSFR